MSGEVKIDISNNPKERYKRFISEYNVGIKREIIITWFLIREEARHLEKNFHKDIALNTLQQEEIKSGLF